MKGHHLLSYLRSILAHINSIIFLENVGGGHQGEDKNTHDFYYLRRPKNKKKEKEKVENLEFKHGK